MGIQLPFEEVLALVPKELSIFQENKNIYITLLILVWLEEYCSKDKKSWSLI